MSHLIHGLAVSLYHYSLQSSSDQHSLICIALHCRQPDYLRFQRSSNVALYIAVDRMCYIGA